MGASLGASELLVLCCTCFLILVLLFMRRKNGLETTIPIVGRGSGHLANLFLALRSVQHCQDWISEGYMKYKSRAFQVQILWSKFIVITGPELINELHRVPEHILSAKEAVADLIQADYTVPRWREGYEFTAALLRNKLTRSLPDRFPAAIDELDCAFREELTAQLRGHEWTALAPAPPLARVICRATNRLLVGLPICRDKEYVDLNVNYTRQIGLSALLIAQFPRWLKPLVSRFMTPLGATYARAEKVVGKLVVERMRSDDRLSDEAHEKPDDYLQWLLDSGDSHPTEPHPIATRLLGPNFVALSTTSLSFLYALYHVAAEPEQYQDPIRREVHEMLSRYGWTTEALQRMRRLDSLMREVQRFHGHRVVVMDRKAMQDYTFSDGTTIRKGETVCVAAHATHLDADVYPHAATFDGFRFYDPADGAGEHLPSRLVSTSTEFLAFGTGRHACPGRFWAATEMKAMMAYMVVHYDMKMERAGFVPSGTYLGGALVPDTNARVLFRRRDSPVY